MWNWIIIVGCYLFAACFLRLIGGFDAAGEALSRWGASESRKRADRVDGFLRSLTNSPDTAGTAESLRQPESRVPSGH